MKGKNISYDYVVVGGGPAGMFFAYQVIKNAPEKSVLIIERGKAVEKRRCPAVEVGKCLKCKYCNITNGSSGAGAFSDGKFSKYNPKHKTIWVGGNVHEHIGVPKTQELIDYVDQIYLDFGATTELEGVGNEEIIDEIRKVAEKVNLHLVDIPIRHIGTDRAHVLFKKFEDYLKEHGVTTLFETEVLDLIVEDNVAKGVIYSEISNEEKVEVLADKVILAVGRSGSSWLEEMCKEHDIACKPSPVDIGVRYELPNSVMEELNKYLYEAKLIGESKNGNKVRTFCQNPGGTVSAEAYRDEYGNHFALVNGHSKKDEKTVNTNLALLATINFEGAKKPMEIARKMAVTLNTVTDGQVMVQRLADIKAGKATTEEGLANNSVEATLKSAVPGDFALYAPSKILADILEFIDAVNVIAPGFADGDNLVYGYEIKFAGNQVILNDKFESSVENLIIIGDGGKLSRGLQGACISGVHAADELCGK